MKRFTTILTTIFLLITILFLVMPAWGQTLVTPSTRLEACAHLAPFGFPQVNILDHTTICRTGYALMHDNSARVSAWVQHMLTPAHVISCGQRPDRFVSDPLIPRRGRSTPQDYARSGYDQGHLAPSADQAWHPQVQQESFFMSNVAPQNPTLNRQLWNQLEQMIRAWTHEHGDHVIITGVIYRDSDRTIGSRNVRVPTHFYKIITHVASNHTWAFLAENTHVSHRVIGRIQSTVHEISMLSQVQFAQPDNPRLRRPLPTVNQRSLNQERSTVCATR